MHPIADALSGSHGGARRTKGPYLRPGSGWAVGAAGPEADVIPDVSRHA